MNKVKHCLTKMHEIIYANKNKTILEIDLLLDYTRIMYSELLEHRAVVVLNNSQLKEKNSEKDNKENVVQSIGKPLKTLVQETIIQKDIVTESSEPINLFTESDSEDIHFEAPVENPNVSENKDNILVQSDNNEVLRVDIRQLISLNDKFAFVIELFNGDNNAYEVSINHINTIDNYGDTMEWVISNLQNKYNWNIENELVLNFYEAVNTRFKHK